MSRLFTFFEILSHNLAFVCAPPPQSTTGHTPHLFCLHLRVYRPAGAIRRSARLLSATIHRALCYGYFAALNTPTPCAIAHAGNTRICARLFRCAQYAVPAPLCAQSIVCTQSNPLRALFTVPPHPHSPHLWRMRRKPARTHDKF